MVGSTSGTCVTNWSGTLSHIIPSTSFVGVLGTTLNINFASFTFDPNGGPCVATIPNTFNYNVFTGGTTTVSPDLLSVVGSSTFGVVDVGMVTSDNCDVGTKSYTLRAIYISTFTEDVSFTVAWSGPCDWNNINCGSLTGSTLTSITFTIDTGLTSTAVVGTGTSSLGCTYTSSDWSVVSLLTGGSSMSGVTLGTHAASGNDLNIVVDVNILSAHGITPGTYTFDIVYQLGTNAGL